MAAPAQVQQVIDPDGAVWLFRVVGSASPATIDQIAAATAPLGARHMVHVDLFDAEIPSAPVMRELERLADRLERAMVRVRMVGLDPSHPAIDERR